MFASTVTYAGNSEGFGLEEVSVTTWFPPPSCFELNIQTEGGGDRLLRFRALEPSVGTECL